MTAVETLVVDASVGAKWVLAEQHSDRAMALLDSAGRGDTVLVAPDVYVPEVTNIVWKSAHLRGDLTRDEAREALDKLLATLPELTSTADLAGQALELALTFGHPSYDCQYVALAVRLGCSVVTADRGMIRAFGPATGRVIDIADFNAGR